MVTYNFFIVSETHDNHFCHVYTDGCGSIRTVQFDDMLDLNVPPPYEVADVNELYEKIMQLITETELANSYVTADMSVLEFVMQELGYKRLDCMEPVKNYTELQRLFCDVQRNIQAVERYMEQARSLTF